MEKFNKNNLFIGTVVERQNVSRDGVGSALIGAYKTIAYKNVYGKYYDFLLKHEMNKVDYSNSQYGTFYFVEEKPYFMDNKDKELGLDEIKQLFEDVDKLSKEQSFVKPEIMGEIRK